MRLGSQGGSQTVSTSQSVTPGTAMTASLHLLRQFLRARAGRRGQRHFHLHRAVVGDVDRVDQAEFVDVHRDFRIVHGRRWRRSSRPRSASARSRRPASRRRAAGSCHSLLASFVAVQRGDQRVPRQRRAFHPRRIFVHARQRLQPFQRLGQRRVAMPGRCRCAPSRGTLRTAPACRPCCGRCTVSAIRSAEATLIAQPRASKPVSAMVPSAA